MPSRSKPLHQLLQKTSLNELQEFIQYYVKSREISFMNLKLILPINLMQDQRKNIKS